MQDLVIIGAGGLAQEITWLIDEINQKSKQWNILGYIINEASESEDIIGNDEWILNYKEKLAVVCCIANTDIRRQVITNLKRNSCLFFPSLISDNAKMSESVKVGEGCIICTSNIMTVNIEIGDFSIINVATFIGHDTIIKEFVTIHPSVNISGNVLIENNTEIGIGTSIIQGKKIGKNVVIGAGTVVIRDIEDGCVVVGNPGKVIKRKE